MARRSSNIVGDLSEREELVLRYIVQSFILTANPVGSRFLSKRFEEESISAATIRNVMSDLEDKGYITHPHTSAGRIPTDNGYRRYVDSLIRGEKLSQADRSVIEGNIDFSAPPPTIMRETSRVLATISSQLGIVTAPEVLDSVLERLELVPLTSSRLLVVLSLHSRIVRTVTLEINEEVPRDGIGVLVQMLNERLAGLTLREIRSTVHERLKDVVADSGSNPIVRIFFDAADRIFTQSDDQRIHIAPAQSMFRQPEFSSADQVSGIVELIENEEVVVHLLEGRQAESRQREERVVEVSIGSEHPDERLADFSMITTRYRVGDTAGTIGLIGPKRMNYSRLIAIVEYVAKTMTSRFEDR